MEEDTDTNETMNTSASIKKSDSKDDEENNVDKELDAVDSLVADTLKEETRPSAGKNDETPEPDPCTDPAQKKGVIKL